MPNKKIDTFMNPLRDEKGTMADDGTFEYYGNGEDFLEKEENYPTIKEMFCNSDNPQEDADDYANMMAERAAED